MRAGGSSSAPAASRGPIALFVVASAALIAAAVLFSRGGGWTSPEVEPSGELAQAGPADDASARLARAEVEVKASARRFMAAFLRYEVGELTPAVRRDLRATTTSEFGRQLLTSPPRRPSAGGFPPHAELRELNVTFLTPQATLAVIDGASVRDGFPEEFGFAFTRSASGWLASGASQ